MSHSGDQDYQTMTTTTTLLSSSPHSFYTTHDDNPLPPPSQPSDEDNSRGRATPSITSSDTLHAQSQSPTNSGDDERQPLLRRSKSNCQSQHQPPSYLDILRSGLSELVVGSLYLENTGSVARDHLANERTFLAWLRTSLSTISVGVGITQLFRLNRAVEHDPYLHTWGVPVGLMFILMAMLFLSFAFVRYFHCQATMVKGYFPASRGIVLFTFATTLLSMVALLLAVFFKR